MSKRILLSAASRLVESAQGRTRSLRRVRTWPCTRHEIDYLGQVFDAIHLKLEIR